MGALVRAALFAAVVLLPTAGVVSQPTSGADATDGCDYIMLVRCLLEAVDDWTIALYELKPNVVTIEEEQCGHRAKLGECIDDRHATLTHGCSHDQVLNTSSTINQLLTHKSDSGNLLASYYLLDYACSDAGRAAIAQQRACLDSLEIGQATLHSSTFLFNTIIQKGDPKVMCETFSDRLSSYQTTLAPFCDGSASSVMCRSLVGMFNGMHQSDIGHCDLSCEQVPIAQPEPAANSEAQNGAVDHGNGNGCPATAPLSAALLLCALVRSLLQSA